MSALGASAASATHAAINVEFTGGNGSPLNITLPAIEWVLPDTSIMNDLFIGIGIAVGQMPSFQADTSSVAGDASAWSSDKAGVSFLGASGGFYTNNDFSLLNEGGLIWFGMTYSGTFTEGDTIRFAGGTISNDGVISETFTDGSYEVYLISGGDGSVISNAATLYSPVVPEPSTYAAIAGLGVLGFVALRRRSR
ncbi:MAG: PEP-CTERM sorting domain-containing protein [Verrucomicrobiota bacterium JB022]|nr:PEP-CTERM sorting domain-containing protein [Verrucomicrobiota bacterium JB022]